jgi:hypothetical protein
MSPPPSTPKRPRKAPPKIVGHTAPTPRVMGTTARSSLRSLAPTSLANGTNRPAVRPPTGAPGMRNFPRDFPRARIDNRRHAGAAVSVRKALSELAEAQTTAQHAAQNLAPQPELLDPAKPRRNRKPGPARPSVRGRPTTPDGPDEQPLAHAPAANRPDEPPLRTTLARIHGEPAPHRATRRRTGNDPTARATIERPRPSRVLAELHAALADEAAAAE